MLKALAVSHRTMTADDGDDAFFQCPLVLNSV